MQTFTIISPCRRMCQDRHGASAALWRKARREVETTVHQFTMPKIRLVIVERGRASRAPKMGGVIVLTVGGDVGFFQETTAAKARRFVFLHFSQDWLDEEMREKLAVALVDSFM
jgi:hypothetical protein